MPVAAWLLEAAPSLILGASFAAVYVVFLARVHSDARRQLTRYDRRRRALERVEWWYPEGRLIPARLVAARTQLESERRALERAGILRNSFRTSVSQGGARSEQRKERGGDRP